MIKCKIEIEAEIPINYEPTGEYRVPEHKEYYLDNKGVVRQYIKPDVSGTQILPYMGPRIILRVVTPLEIQGPSGWPELRWACKDNNGYWNLFAGTPTYLEGTWAADGPWILALVMNWTPPSEIADLPPEKSLVQLRHTCKWESAVHTEYVTECGCVMMCEYKYCPHCGREVEIVS